MKQYKNKLFKSLLGTALCFSALVWGTSCDQLEDEFYNPDQVTEAKLDFFFTEALKKGQLFRLEYGPTYHANHTITRQLALGSHRSMIFTRHGNTSAVEYWTTWSGGVFNNNIFERTGVDFTVNINGMQLLYNDMSDEDKEIYKIFILCSRIVKGYAFQRDTDLFDAVPYFEAGGAFEQKFYPKYDSQEEIYTAVLADLEEASKELEAIIAAGGLSSASALLFNPADILNSGDLDKWVRFSNSIRLRMAMRLVNVKPEVSRELVTKLITENRLVTEAQHEILFKERDQSTKAVTQDEFFRGFTETGQMLVGTEFVLDDILHADAADPMEMDPRIHVLFQSNRYGEYVGHPMKMDDYSYYKKHWGYLSDADFKARVDSVEVADDLKAQDPQAGDGSGGNWYIKRLVARWNRSTFMNYDMSYPVISANEVNLIIAEASLRWGIGNQEEAIRKAIDTSTRYYYNINMSNKYNESSSPTLDFIQPGSKVDKLDEAHLSAYINHALAEYNSMDFKGKLKFIFHQKYIHNNILYYYETFSEARRVIYDLGEIPIRMNPNHYWWERLLIPDTEDQTNTENFAKVKDRNYVNKTVWWSGRDKAAINPNASPGVSLELPY